MTTEQKMSEHKAKWARLIGSIIRDYEGSSLSPTQRAARAIESAELNGLFDAAQETFSRSGVTEDDADFEFERASR